MGSRGPNPGLLRVHSAHRLPPVLPHVGADRDEEADRRSWRPPPSQRSRSWGSRSAAADGAVRAEVAVAGRGNPLDVRRIRIVDGLRPGESYRLPTFGVRNHGLSARRTASSSRGGQAGQPRARDHRLVAFGHGNDRRGSDARGRRTGSNSRTTPSRGCTRSLSAFVPATRRATPDVPSTPPRPVDGVARRQTSRCGSSPAGRSGARRPRYALAPEGATPSR